jgi:hypothetical protein
VWQVLQEQFEPGESSKDRRVNRTRQSGVEWDRPGFKLSRDAFYQVSNRMAWGWRLASLGVPVTVLYLGFVQDPYWPKDRFESNEDWLQAAAATSAMPCPSMCSSGGSSVPDEVRC